MKQQSNLIQNLCIGAILICVLVVGYIFLKPNGQTENRVQNISGLAPVVEGKQLIQMKVLSVSYEPNYFKVKVGVPVKWEITPSGSPGCASGALIARGLIDGPVYLNPNAGQVTTAEFTPQTAGEYTFSCPMGMVKGKIVVVN